ncbi:MAG: transcriptional regulator [Symploca sp. SIO2B6]|nr:transcriptional regulator [Symploca sp. SIO2B6]
MIATFNPITYNNLLTEVTPKVIETEEEYEKMLEVVEALIFKKNRSLEEMALYKLLVLLVETYESDHYPMAKPSPDEILRHIMEASRTQRQDLVGLLGSSEIVEGVINGKQPISQTQAHILGDLFQLSPNLFL